MTKKSGATTTMKVLQKTEKIVPRGEFQLLALRKSLKLLKIYV